MLNAQAKCKAGNNTAKTDASCHVVGYSSETQSRWWIQIQSFSKILLFRSNTAGNTLTEKDHLGDWSPEKDCCL